MKPKLLSDKELNTIRGKSLVGTATPQELVKVFGHIDCLEMELDQRDGEDYYDTEGWRHGHPDAD
jgi:hypothetical protein